MVVHDAILCEWGLTNSLIVVYNEMVQCNINRESTMSNNYEKPFEKVSEKVSEAFKHAQAPLQELAELNIKTVQSYAYPQAADLSKFNKPEQFFEKQLELVIANGHKTLDYLQQAFKIFEKSATSFSKQAKDLKEEIVSHKI